MARTETIIGHLHDELSRLDHVEMPGHINAPYAFATYDGDDYAFRIFDQSAEITSRLIRDIANGHTQKDTALAFIVCRSRMRGWKDGDTVANKHIPQWMWALHALGNQRIWVYDQNEQSVRAWHFEMFGTEQRVHISDPVDFRDLTTSLVSTSAQVLRQDKFRDFMNTFFTADIGQAKFWEREKREQEREQARRDWEDAKTGRQRRWNQSGDYYANFDDFFEEVFGQGYYNRQRRSDHDWQREYYQRYGDFWDEDEKYRRQEEEHRRSQNRSRTTYTSASSDHYATLGVSANATQDEVKKAYRKLARENHPDMNPNDRDAATRKTQEINAAWEAVKKQHNWY